MTTDAREVVARPAASVLVVPVLATALAVAPVGLVATDAGLDAPWELLVALLVGATVSLVAVGSVVRRTASAVRPGDVVTLLRTGLVGACCGWVVLIHLTGLPPRTWWLAAVAGVAWAMDGLDGYVARRTGTASGAGARLDMEVDALLLVALSLAVAPVVGWWVVLVGAMRYLWWGLLRVVPRLRAELPFRQRRRVVAAVQGGVLAAVVVPVVPVPLAVLACAVALLLLVGSFGADAVWSWRRQPARPRPTAAPI